MTMFTTRRVLAFAGAALLLVLAIAIAACGTSSGTHTTTGTGTRTTASIAAGRPDLAKLRTCLQQQGVALPRLPAGGPSARPRRFGPGGISSAQRDRLRQAVQKCGGGFRRFRAGAAGAILRSPRFRAALLRYAACMRANGVDLPAPDQSGKGPIFDPSRLNRQDPRFLAASGKCRGLLAGAARGAGAPVPPPPPIPGG